MGIVCNFLDAAIKPGSAWGAQSAGIKAPSWAIKIDVDGKPVEVNFRGLCNDVSTPNSHWTDAGQDPRTVSEFIWFGRDDDINPILTNFEHYNPLLLAPHVVLDFS